MPCFRLLLSARQAGFLLVYLPHVDGGQTDPVHLASVCADGQSLLSRTHAHGDNLLSLGRGRQLAVRVRGDLAQEGSY